jgi:hypothetical protein
MNDLVGIILTVVNGALAIAILALIISPKAKTGEVIGASASGFSSILSTAMSPVTGGY